MNWKINLERARPPVALRAITRLAIRLMGLPWLALGALFIWTARLSAIHGILIYLVDLLYPQSAMIYRIHLLLAHSIQWVMRPIFWRRAIVCTRSMASQQLGWAIRRLWICCAQTERIRRRPSWRSSIRCPNAVSVIPRRWSMITDRWSLLDDHWFWITDHRHTVNLVDRLSVTDNHWYLITGCWSLIAVCWSLITHRLSLIEDQCWMITDSGSVITVILWSALITDR